MTATIISDGQTTLTFDVVPHRPAEGRIFWLYTVTDVSGTVLATGTDLSTPNYGHPSKQGPRALESLLSFATAAAESYAYGGTEFSGFPLAAVEAFHQLSDEIASVGYEWAEYAETEA